MVPVFEFGVTVANPENNHRELVPIGPANARYHLRIDFD